MRAAGAMFDDSIEVIFDALFVARDWITPDWSSVEIEELWGNDNCSFLLRHKHLK